MANISGKDSVAQKTDFEPENECNDDLLFYIAANSPKAVIERALSKGGVTLSYKNENGDTAMHLAVGSGNKEVVDLLISKGSRVDIPNNSGKTPIDLAVEKLQNDSSAERNSILESLKGGPSPKNDNEPCPKKSKLNETENGSSLKRPSSSTDATAFEAKKPKLDLMTRSEENLTRFESKYAAAGLKLSLHGVIFQTQLLILFAHRAKTKKLWPFRIATEMNDAHKFDDIVFQYPNPNESNKHAWRFIQAKHKLDPENKKNKISKTDLMSTSDDNNFSIQKYFISFCTIKHNKRFDGGSLEVFLIVTNANFDEDVKKWFENEVDLRCDKILFFENHGFKAEKYKFDIGNKDVNELKEKLKMNLLDGALEAQKRIDDLSSLKEKLNVVKMVYFGNLIKESIEKMKKGRETKAIILSESSKILKYFRILEKYKEEADFKNVRENLNDAKQKEIGSAPFDAMKITVFEKANEILNEVKNAVDLTGNVAERLKELKDDILASNHFDSLKKHIQSLHDDDVEKFMSSVETKINSELKSAGKAKDNAVGLKEYYDNFDDLLKEFFEKFHFITNYPKVEDLETLIYDEIGECKEFNLIQPDLLGAEFERKMLNFLMSYENGWAEFCKSDDIDRFFEKLKGQLSTLMVCGLNQAYINEIKGSGIGFQKDLKKLRSFLVDDRRVEVFHISTSTVRLTAIKALQTIETCAHFQKDDSFIFTSVKTLLECQQLILNAFEMDKTHNLLVIECPSEAKPNSNDINSLSRKISKIQNKNSLKKIVLIGHNDDKLLDKFPRYEREMDQPSFGDLDSASKGVILQKQVDFQHRSHSVPLSRLIDENSAENIFDQFILSRFLGKKMLSIGDQTAFTSIGFQQDYYIERQFRYQVIKREVFKIVSELFFITGADPVDLTKLGVQRERIQIYEHKTLFDSGTVILPQHGYSNQSSQEIFAQLGQTAHWLHFYDSNLFWVASKDNFVALANFVDTGYDMNENGGLNDDGYDDESELSDDDESVLSVKDHSSMLRNSSKKMIIFDEMYFSTILNQKVVIVANDAGMGKSTMLTSLAGKMKNVFDDLWIVRSNLNSCTQFLNKIDFIENDTSQAIEFVTKMAIPAGDNANEHLTRFQRNLFRVSLEGPMNQNAAKTPRVIIMFDGFDEITPGHKSNTTTLIKALMASQVTQLWVTTRIHEKSDLEQRLGIPAYVILPFNKNDQIKFIGHFWKWQLKYQKNSNSDEICERPPQDILNYLKQIQPLIEEHILPQKTSISEAIKSFTEEKGQCDANSLRRIVDGLDFFAFIKILNKKWEDLFRNTDERFTVNPLHLEMLAEVIFQNEFKLPNQFGLFNLYDKFIKMKFQIYYHDKVRIEMHNEGAKESIEEGQPLAYKTHKALAVKLFFNDLCKHITLPGLKVLKTLESNKEGKRQMQKCARRGILCLNNGRLEFIHRSFAEYFMSVYLVENIEHERVQELLVAKILLEDEYKVIRQFLNDQLEKDPKHIKFNKAIISLISNMPHKYDLEKPLIALVAEDRHIETMQFLLNAIQSDCALYETVLIDIFNNENSVCHEKVIEPLLKASLKLQPDKIRTHIFKYCESGNLLWKAIERRNYKIVEIIINFLALNESSLGKEFVAMFILDCSRKFKFEITFRFENDDAFFKRFIHLLRRTFQENVLRHFLPPIDEFISNGSSAEKIIELLKDDSEALNDYLLTTDFYGQTVLTKAIEECSRSNLAQQFVKSICDFVDGSQISDDFLILSAYGGSTPERSTDLLVNCVKNGSEIHAKLTSIQNNLNETHRKKRILCEAFRYSDINEIRDICRRWNDSEIKEILLMDLPNDETVFQTAANHEKTEIVHELFDRIRSSPEVLEEILIGALHNSSAKTLLSQMKVIKEFFRGSITLDQFLIKHAHELVSAVYATGTLYDAEQIFGKSILRALITQTNTFHLIQKDDCIQAFDTCLNPLTIESKLRNTKKYPEIAKELAVKTNYFGQTIWQYLVDRHSNLDSEIISSYLLSLECLNVADDLVILSVFGDARTDPAQNIEKLFNFIRNARKLHVELGALQARLTDVKKAKLALDEAISEGKIDEVRSILNENESYRKELLLMTNNDGYTALHSAVQHNQCEIVRILLEALEEYPRFLEEMVIKIDKYHQETALHLAVKLGHRNIVFHLLNFMQKHHEDHYDIEKLLLKHNGRGLSVICATNYGENNASILQWAKENLGENALIKLIREANSFNLVIDAVYIRNNYDEFKYKRSVLLNNIEKFEHLKKYPEILRNNFLQTHGHRSTVLLNVAKTYQYSSLHRDKDNLHTLLEISLQHFDHPSLEDLAVISVYGSNFSDHKSILVKLLNDDYDIKKNIDLWRKLKLIEANMDEVERKRCQLEFAIRSGNEFEVKAILDQNEMSFVHKAILLACNHEGYTVLHTAVQQNQSQQIEILLKSAEKYPRIQEEMLLEVDRCQENTALHLAAEFGRHENIQSFFNLVKDFKNVKVIEKMFKQRNKNDMTPLQVASEKNHPTIVLEIEKFMDNTLPALMKRDQIKVV